ncbi:hypothetical protein ES708_31758 [subsurface metagenome]
MLVCSQYKRFIELIFEKEAESFFKDKYVISLSTSIHFYDHTAQNYIRAICDDLGMKFFGYFAADSWDLLYSCSGCFFFIYKIYCIVTLSAPFGLPFKIVIFIINYTILFCIKFHLFQNLIEYYI